MRHRLATAQPTKSKSRQRSLRICCARGRAGWFRDYDDALLQNFADAVDEGRRMQGPDVKKWAYGAYLELTIAHPIGHRLPLVAKYFDIGPVWMSGSTTSVKQTTLRLGPSMRMNADLGDWDRSLHEFADWPIRTRALAALQGSVGRLLQRHELSHAVPKGRGGKYAGVCARGKVNVQQSPSLK